MEIYIEVQKQEVWILKEFDVELEFDIGVRGTLKACTWIPVESKVASPNRD